MAVRQRFPKLRELNLYGNAMHWRNDESYDWDGLCPAQGRGGGLFARTVATLILSPIQQVRTLPTPLAIECQGPRGDGHLPAAQKAAPPARVREEPRRHAQHPPLMEQRPHARGQRRVWF